MRETAEKQIPVNPAHPARMPNVRDFQGFVLFNSIQSGEISWLLKDSGSPAKGDYKYNELTLYEVSRTVDLANWQSD
jgi:hypothetical protein